MTCKHIQFNDSQFKVSILFTGINFDWKQLENYSIPQPSLLEQVHGNVLWKVSQNNHTEHLKGDALWADSPGLSLAVKTADCVPILLWHSSGKIAAIHAGWRGTQQEILEKTLSDVFSTLPIEGLHAWIGPAICAQHYEVDMDVAQYFIDDDPQNCSLLKKKYHLNLPAIHKKKLLKFGLLPQFIQTSQSCTFEMASDYYSYRRNFKQNEVSEKKVSSRNYSIIYFQKNNIR